MAQTVTPWSLSKRFSMVGLQHWLSVILPTWQRGAYSRGSDVWLSIIVMFLPSIEFPDVCRDAKLVTRARLA
jgi:hypothetical protein